MEMRVGPQRLLSEVRSNYVYGYIVDNSETFVIIAWPAFIIESN